MKYELKKRYVAYIDILGYKNEFSKRGFNSVAYLKLIKKCFKYVKEIFFEYSNEKIGVKVFSDNAVIIFENDNIILIKWLLATLQKELLLDFGLLIRGSIVYGEIYMDNDLVYGQALIDAYKLENEAEFPRVIIQKEIGETFFENDGYRLVELGENNFYEIAYLRENEDDTEKDILKLKKQIIKIIEENCKITDSNVKEHNKIIYKYNWLLIQYNTYYIFNQISYYFDISNEKFIEIKLLK